MAIITYTNEPHGFGFTYDDADLDRVDDRSDPRFSAARFDRLGRTAAAAVLFTVRGASAEQVAAGTALSALITTDDVPRRDLGGWDWNAVTRREGVRFLERTGTPHVVATQTYWRGYPVLGLSTSPSSGEPRPGGLETLGVLFTPQQTFESLMVFPLERDDETWPELGQALMDGFFLVPIEREGRQRLSHQYVGQTDIYREGEATEVVPMQREGD